MTDVFAAEAAARTRAAAEAAPVAREFDVRTFTPVRGDHLAVVVEALKEQQRTLDRICEHLGITP